MAHRSPPVSRFGTNGDGPGTDRGRTRDRPGTDRGRTLAGALDVRIAAIAIAISGLAALVYEVAWTRLLALVIGPTTYAFSTMAATFIAGLALGSALSARASRWTANPLRWLGLALGVSGVAAVGAAW